MCSQLQLLPDVDVGPSAWAVSVRVCVTVSESCGVRWVKLSNVSIFDDLILTPTSPITPRQDHRSSRWPRGECWRFYGTCLITGTQFGVCTYTFRRPVTVLHLKKKSFLKRRIHKMLLHKHTLISCVVNYILKTASIHSQTCCMSYYRHFTVNHWTVVGVKSQ